MPRPRTIPRDRVAALIAQKLDDRQIAERLGCTSESINRIRNDLAGTHNDGARYRPSDAHKAVVNQDAMFSARLSAAARAGKTAPNVQRESGSKGFEDVADSEVAR